MQGLVLPVGEGDSGSGGNLGEGGQIPVQHLSVREDGHGQELWVGAWSTKVCLWVGGERMEEWVGGLVLRDGEQGTSGRRPKVPVMSRTRPVEAS